MKKQLKKAVAYARVHGAQAAASLFGLTVLAVESAMAALPTGVDTAIEGIQTDATSLAAIVAPVMIGILATTIVFKLVKRFGNKI